jgi:hypothetical protein
MKRVGISPHPAYAYRPAGARFHENLNCAAGSAGRPVETSRKATLRRYQCQRQRVHLGLRVRPPPQTAAG